jgi:hypothetical protein
MKKTRLNRLEFLKNQSVQFGFGFISLKPKKPSQTRKKPSQIKKTSFCSKIIEPNQNQSI